MNCTRHPDEAVSGACDRCGDFVCRLDSEKQSTGKTICARCKAEFGAVDWLEAFKAELWGKRDGWAWFFGLGGLLGALALVVMVMQVALAPTGTPLLVWIQVPVTAAGIVTQIAFFLGYPWARKALLGFPLLGLLMAVGQGGADAAVGFVSHLIALLLVVAAYYDPRTKLFFKVDITEPQLLKIWDRTRNNLIARNALGLGLLGLLFPVVGVLAILCGMIGLSRVNPKAAPPVGKKGYAIAGIVLGAVSTLLWIAVVVAAVLKK